MKEFASVICLLLLAAAFLLLEALSVFSGLVKKDSLSSSD